MDGIGFVEFVPLLEFAVEFLLGFVFELIVVLLVGLFVVLFCVLVVVVVVLFCGFVVLPNVELFDVLLVVFGLILEVLLLVELYI